MDHSQTIADYAQDFLTRLGASSSDKLTVNYDSDTNIYSLSLESSHPSLLIGFHGENLSALQLILSQHLHAKLGEWVNLQVNVNDYRQRREVSLHALADSIVARVISTGQPHTLPPMSASERRVIHLYLAEHPQVSTASQGEGRSRSIVVSPRV